MNDGGSAFPQCGAVGPSDSGFDSSDFCGRGLTLRDYFAAKAMQGLLSRHSELPGGISTYALDSYKMADAMLAERQKGAV